MTRKTPSKPQVSEAAAKAKAELSAKDLDKVTGGAALKAPVRGGKG